jgi:Phage Mu protein F like protein
MKQSRGQRIARTRAVERQTDTTLQWAIDNPPSSGGVWTKTWQAEDDCCDECAALDGVTIDADDTFDGGYDGPGAHPNCKCSLELNERYPGFAEILANQIMADV